MISNQDIDLLLEKLSNMQHLLSSIERVWLADFAARYQKAKEGAAQQAEVVKPGE